MKQETGFDKLENFYKEKIEILKKQAGKLKKHDTSLGIAKLLLFFAGFFFLIKLYPQDFRLALGVFAFFIFLFIITAFIHESVLEKIRGFRRREDINRSEIDMVTKQFSPSIVDGTEFKDGDHRYTSDLDIFGENSVFHYINRTVTALGRRKLARWLQAPATVREIRERQEGIKELANKTDFRQNLRAHGMTIDDTSQKLESLQNLLKEKFILAGRKGFILFIYLLPAVTLGLFIGMGFGVSLEFPLAGVVIQFMVNWHYNKKISKLYRETAKNTAILKAYYKIVTDIENESFQSEYLRNLQKRLYLNNKPASGYIKRLVTTMEWFETRLSDAFHFVVNNVIFLDLHCVYRIEKWKQEASDSIGDWFGVMADFEALSSFANVYFNNPGWVFPEIREDGFRLEAKNLGHPLIRRDDRVCNDVSFDEKGGILVVTGPNMAGKSTFLRTVGVNTVTALAGGPVCAEMMTVSRLNMVTSMQTTDSLDKHLSLFYAELQRLKMVLDAVKEEKEVFFIIDEMLKGTNEMDRSKGAVVLVNQLAKLGASGIAATHDLELTKLATPDNLIYNAHFDGYVEEDRLLFDYLLKDDICQSFNALVLMKKIGIEL